LRIFFISANENLSDGLMQSQFIKPAEELLLNGNLEVCIVNYHMPFSKPYKNKKFKVINLPILVPFRFINFTPFFIFNELLSIFYAFLLSLVIKKNDMIYSRAYVPGLIGFWIRKIKKIYLIFDPRSLYIHENVGIKLKINSLCYYYWKNVEKRLVLNSDEIIAVSSGQKDYYIENYRIKSSAVKIIPCFTSVNKVLAETKLLGIRRLIGFSSDDIVIGYIGSLNNGWNNKELYKEYFKTCLECSYKILIITQDKERLMNDPFFCNPNLKLYSFNDKIDKYLIDSTTIQIADYGIVLLNKTHDWFTRLTVKFVDYTSNGLPVIAHVNVGEAANLINKYNLKPSICINEPSDINCLSKPLSLQKELILNWSNTYFSKSNLFKIFD
jgi:hypothetical protein